jgi:hypothetical protein
MQKKLRKPQKSQAFIDTEVKCMSFMPVNRNGWWIKFSTSKDGNVLLLFTSMFTGQTVVRFFENEDEAVKFVNFITECDPTEELVFQ